MQKNFLIWNVIEKKCRYALNELENTLEQIKLNENLIVIKSLFVYGVSTFESAMTDILRAFCEAYPYKIPTKEMQFSREQILGRHEVMVEMLLDTGINNLAYGSLKKYATKFSTILEIRELSHIDRLIEIKETRNLMVHNNLIINRLYLAKCEDSCRRATEKDIHEKLNFDKRYADESINICIDVFKNDILNELKKKYSSNTKIKAMQEIWNELFHSSILNFDEYWEYDEEGNLLSFKKDNIVSLFETGYSTTEKTLMALIMRHYWGSIRQIDSVNADYFNLNTMNKDRRDKFLFLQDVLDRYPDLFTQDSR